MAYQALYRKFRPDNFEDVKGQEHIVTALKNQISMDRVGHAYIFSGTRGTGKTTVAKIFARAVNCENPQDGNPCGQCPTCKSIASGAAFCVSEIDAASNNGVDSMRDLKDDVMYPPTVGRYKVYIIDEAHMVTTQAFNAMLKTIEEPPEYVIFIMATTELNKIPQTIRSRCQQYEFHRITIDTITDRLKELMQIEGNEAEDKALRYVAKAGDGSMRDSLSLLEQCLAFHPHGCLTYDNVLDTIGTIDADRYKELLDAVLARNVAACLKFVENVIMQGLDLTTVVSDFVWYLRNALVVKSSQDEDIEDIIDMSTESIAALKEQAQTVDIDTLMRLIRVSSELVNTIKFEANKRIKVETSLIKMCRPSMERDTDVDELKGRLASMEAMYDSLKLSLADAMDQLKSGRVLIADSSKQASSTEEETPSTMSREELESLSQAMPDDLKRAVELWNQAIANINEPLIGATNNKFSVMLDEGNMGLKVLVGSESVYGLFKNEGMGKKIEDELSSLVGAKVDIKFFSHADMSGHSKTYDIREVINMDIETEDSEGIDANI